MENLTPYPVITSKEAKNHLGKAKTLMDETYAGIVMQRNRLNQMSNQAQQAALNQQQTQQDFRNESMLQQQKMLAVNPLT